MTFVTDICNCEPIEPMVVKKGESIILPTPVCTSCGDVTEECWWDVGGFGTEYTPTGDTEIVMNCQQH